MLAVIVSLRGLLVRGVADWRVCVDVGLDDEGLHECSEERGQNDRDPRALWARDW
jgi:hypothetical protein